MGRYSMYFGTRLEVEESLMREDAYNERKKLAKREKRQFTEEKPDTLRPLTFRLKGKLQEKFKLEELDALTSGYKTEEDFIVALSKLEGYEAFFKKAPDKHLIITHQSKGRIIKNEVIFNNEMIRKYAYELIRNTATSDRRAIRLSDSKELDELVKRVKAYTLNPVSTSELRNSKYCDYMLKQELDSFLKLRTKNFITPEEQDDLFDIERSINNNMHKYKTLRGFIVWEERYKKLQLKQENKVQEKANLDVQYKMLDSSIADDYKAQIEEEKRIYAENRDLLESVITDDDIFIKDEQLAQLFRDGGTQAILEQMDANDIYNKSTSDLEKVGILPKESSKRR